MSSKKISRKNLFYYGLSEMPISIASLPLLTYLPNYYGQEIGISLSAIATIWLFTRIFDAITDPLIGYWSDKTDTRWGRRRIWMVASIPILVISVYNLFFPNEDTVTSMHLFIWLALFWFGWTMLLIPYYAWGAELSPDYHERSTITAWRSWLGVFGNVVSKSIPTLALFFFAYGGTREVTHMIGIFMLILIPLTIILTTVNVPEKKDYKTAYIPIIKGIKIMWANLPFRRLILAFFLYSTAVSISGSTFIFFIRGVIADEKAGIALLLSYYVVNLCAIPFWVWVGKRIEKHTAWIFGMLTFIITNPFYLLLGPGDIYWMTLGLMITGLGGATSLIFPNSMKADVIDLDKINSGEDRAAIFFSVWSFVMKIAYSFGPWFALMLLSYSSYDPTPEAMNSESQLFGLRYIYALSTTIFMGATILTIYNYPLTKKRHEEIREELEALNN